MTGKSTGTGCAAILCHEAIAAHKKCEWDINEQALGVLRNLLYSTGISLLRKLDP
jgi:hypothetical protein